MTPETNFENVLRRHCLERSKDADGRLSASILQSAMNRVIAQ
jgi:hypothetical protein